MASIINQAHYTLATVGLYPLLQSVLSVKDSTDYVLIKFRLHTHTHLTLAIHKKLDMVEWRIRNSVIPVLSPTTLKNYDLVRRLSDYWNSLRNPSTCYYTETLSLLLDIITKIYSTNTGKYRIDYTTLSAMVLDCYYYYSKIESDNISAEFKPRMDDIIRIVNSL